MQEIIYKLLSNIVDDPDREGLKETPRRVSEAYKFWTGGYAEDPAAVLKVFEDGASDYDQLVFQGGIPIYSLCEHHLVPFFGVVHIGYISQGKIVGLSKLSRLVDVFARRLQVQERLTSQIVEVLEAELKPLGVGVVVRCRHLCMESRGVQKSGTITYTSALKGEFKDSDSARAEFMRLVSLADSHSGSI